MTVKELIEHLKHMDETKEVVIMTGTGYIENTTDVEWDEDNDFVVIESEERED